jgi:hypothetical protein
VYQPAEQIATSEMKVGMAMPQVTAVDELFGTHRLRVDSAQHGDFVTQDQELDVLRACWQMMLVEFARGDGG